MSFYKYLLILFILLAGVSTVSADIVFLNQTHGETWVKWSWTLDNTDYGTAKILAYYLDGTLVGTYDLLATPQALVPTEYSLPDTQPSEQHSMKVVLMDNSTIPATLLDTETLSASTSPSSTYYYVILGLGFALFVISILTLASRLVLIGLVLDVGAVLIFTYLATAAYQFSPALSTIAIILGIISFIPIIYALYKAYENSQNWKE